MFQLRKMRIEELAPFRIWRIFRIRHVRKQKVQQRVLVGVGELAVGIAPLAVILVEVAVEFAANHRIVTEGHAAALAKKLARGTEQRIDGNVEFARKHLEHFGVRLRLAGFPAANCLSGHVDAFGHLVLGEIVLFADVLQNILGRHRISFVRLRSQIYLRPDTNARNRLLRCVKYLLVLLLFAILFLKFF